MSANSQTQIVLIHIMNKITYANKRNIFKLFDSFNFEK